MPDDIDTAEQSDGHEAAAHSATAEADATVSERVSATLELIRPALQMDGGDISLIDVDAENVVSVSLHGSCVGCPASMATLKAGVERILMDRVPEVREVVAVET